MASGPAVAVNGVKLRCTSQARLESGALKETSIVVSKLRRGLSTLGWEQSTSGGISAARRSGVDKERVLLQNTCVSSANRTILSLPSRKTYSRRPVRLADGAPFFMKAEGFQYLYNNSLKLHQLGPNYLAANRGLCKGVVRYASIFAKAQNSDLDHTAEPSPHCVVLDIEGTTTPISFVTDVLFPYARDNVGRHLSATFETPETRDDIKLLRSQVDEDLRNGVHDSVPIPSDEAGKEDVIAALVSNVQAMIKADRKITALKQLQGHIWKTGFENNELEGVVFEDVPEALKKWHSLGIKVYIYSSGSRLAQRLIFGRTNFGDLRKYLCGFFDTNVGNKKETRSYIEISESLGVDRPSEILFVTDVCQEAIAAKAAGLEVLVSIRPGNGPLPENHGFKTIHSFSEI